MDLELPEIHRTIRDTARTFARAEVAPAAARWDADRALPSALWPKLGELGLLGVTVPESHGGAELDGLALALVVEELARADGSLGLLVAVHNAMVAAPLAAGIDAGSDAAGLVTALASGERIGGVALGEPCAARLVRDGGAVRLDGAVPFVAPADASVLLLPAADAGERARAAVDADADGLARTRIEGLGFRAAGLSDVQLEGARVDAARVLEGDPADAQDAAAEAALAAVALGLGEGALEAAVAYAKDREQFGQPIAGFQAIQWMIADARAELDAARVLVWRAATGHSAPEATMARLRAGEAASAAGHRALQIHGGYGYTTDFPVERMLRDAASCEALLGGSRAGRASLAAAILEA